MVEAFTYERDWTVLDQEEWAESTHPNFITEKQWQLTQDFDTKENEWETAPTTPLIDLTTMKTVYSHCGKYPDGTYADCIEAFL